MKKQECELCKNKCLVCGKQASHVHLGSDSFCSIECMTAWIREACSAFKGISKPIEHLNQLNAIKDASLAYCLEDVRDTPRMFQGKRLYDLRVKISKSLDPFYPEITNENNS